MANRVLSFADLTHTGQVVSANTFPLGAASVAAYARQELPGISVDVFRYPEDFSKWLDTNVPDMVCFSLFAWNTALSHEFANQIKRRHPHVISVFGGVNIPSDSDDLRRFLTKWPAIDFCVEGEGEEAFVELYRALDRHGFDAVRLKSSRKKVGNTRYLVDGELVRGEMLPRISDLDKLPSTFADGFCDKFFDNHLIPMVTTCRGCPYSCTFCHEGDSYFSKTRRFSRERVTFELEYVAQRVKVPDFIITDLNFGIYEEDVETAAYLAGLQDRTGWPKFVTLATAKNNKERVLKISRLLRGALPPGAPVQSTDPDVLATIKRKNLPLDAVREVALTAEVDGAVSFSEVILCLPGDSKRAHFKSLYDVLDKGFTLVRSYQFLMLNGTEAAGQESRRKNGLKTKFRVKPMNFGHYTVYGERFSVAEVEEICVTTANMTYEEYKECRGFDLTVEIFNNNGIFFDLFQFAGLRGVSRADLIRNIYEAAIAPTSPIAAIYQDFRDEEAKNLSDSAESLERLVRDPVIIDRYISGEYGTNEIYKARARAVFNTLEGLHDIVFGVARRLLEANGRLDAVSSEYLDELKRFSFMRKRSVMDTTIHDEADFTFDFIELTKRSYTVDPALHHRPEGLRIEIYHSDWQKELISGYARQFGTTTVGLGRILNRAHIGKMHRSARIVGTDIAYEADLLNSASE